MTSVIAKFRKKRKKMGNSREVGEIIVLEKKGPMVRAFELLAALPKDSLVKGRGKHKPQKRNGL